MKFVIITCLLLLACTSVLGEAPLSLAQNATTPSISASFKPYTGSCINKVTGKTQSYTYWKGTRIVGLSSAGKPETWRASSLKKCVSDCCSSRLCFVFAWKKSSKTCYSYGLVFIDDNNLKRASGWTAGKA
jgi:hypothetical protein